MAELSTSDSRHIEGRSHMSATVHTTEKPLMKLRHATKETAPLVPGRRAFFTYRDLGVTDASNGQIRSRRDGTITSAMASSSML
jgi:hypothetical protein